MSIVVSSNGIPCELCEQPSEVRQHEGMPDPGQFRQWYICRNPDCSRQMFSFACDKVMEELPAARLPI